MGAVEEMMCVVCYRGDIVVIDVIWRRICVIIIIYPELGKSAMSETGKYLFRVVNVLWSILLLPLVARCLDTIDTAHVGVYVSCSYCMGVWEWLLCNGRCQR